MMFNKLGISNPIEKDKVLISDLLEMMELKKAITQIHLLL